MRPVTKPVKNIVEPLSGRGGSGKSPPFMRSEPKSFLSFLTSSIGNADSARISIAGYSDTPASIPVSFAPSAVTVSQAPRFELSAVGNDSGLDLRGV